MDDRNLLKKQQEVTRQLKQDNNKITIDISIAESRIKDLEGLKEMTLSQIKDILTEKRRVDKENMELEQRIQGKGVSEQEAKQKQFDAEREQIKKIQNSLKFQKEHATNLMERLKEEEINGKNMLDEKIKLQQELNLLTESLAEIKGIQFRNRQEIITLNIKKSQLEALEGRQDEELKKVHKENEEYIKKNQEFEKENEGLNTEIATTIQKIDINSLLKEIDVEDMRLLAQNNKNMNMALHNLISKWETINKQDHKF